MSAEDPDKLVDPVDYAEVAAERIARRKPGVAHLLGHLYLLAQIMQLASEMTETRWLDMCREFWQRAELRKAQKDKETNDVQ